MSALSALGVAPETPSFPAVVRCPLCQKNTLHLFDDIFTDGIWLHCNSCLAHGDIITFGAQIWNISLPAALTKLSDLGVLVRSEINRLAGEYSRAVQKQQLAAKFWAETAGQIWNHGNDAVACRLREYGVREEIGNTEGLVGVAHPDQVTALCRAIGRQRPYTVRRNGVSLVFPYYDLPGRLTGFLLLGLTEAGQKRYFLKLSSYRMRRPNAGYFFLHSLLAPTLPAIRGKQFIVDDPEWVLTEQCRQLRHGFKLLPIVAGYSGEEAVSYGMNWSAFGPATRIFQGQTATPELYSQAASAKGHIALTNLECKSPRNGGYTLRRLSEMYSRAVPWHKALHDMLSASNELTAYSFATQLTAPHEKLQRFFQKYAGAYSEDFKNRVLQAINTAPSAPVQVHKKWTLLEQDNNWFTHTGQLVCDARVVIEKIIQADDGKKQYVGRIYQGDWEIGFVDDARRVEGMGLLAYASSVAAPSGKLITFDRSWNKRSHILATQLHKPELVIVSARIGWDSVTSLFRFGNYALNNAGEVARDIPPAQLTDQPPFPEPNPVAPITVRQFLTPGPQNAFVWNVFSTITANLIAPIVNKDCTATAIQADAFDIAVKIGRELNCRHAQTTNLQRGSAASFVRSQTEESAWPVFVSSLFDETLLMLSVPKSHNQPVLARLPPTGAAVALGYGWQSLITSTAPAITTDFSALRHVLPAYIQRALKNRMSLAAHNKNLHLAVLEDLHSWLELTYGETFHLPQATRQILTPAAAHEALMAEIHRAIQAEKLDLIPRPRRKDQPKNYLLRRKENWWINRRAIDNYTHASKNIPPNWLTIIDLLVQAGVFNGEETVQGMPGILVRAEWCEKFWSDDSSSVREIG